MYRLPACATVSSECKSTPDLLIDFFFFNSRFLSAYVVKQLSFIPVSDQNIPPPL